MTEGLIENVEIGQFNRLIQEIIQSSLKRSTFQTWELELLLDLESCRIRRSAREDLLRRYQRAVQKQLGGSGNGAISRISDFLANERGKRAARAAAGG